MTEKDLDDIAEEQGWTPGTLLTVLTDYLHASGHYPGAVRYAQDVAARENEG